MYNKKCTCYIFILIFLPTFLDGLQRKVETEKLSNNLISDNVELPKEWKNQDWGKTERLLQKSNGRNDTAFAIAWRMPAAHLHAKLASLLQANLPYPSK